MKKTNVFIIAVIIVCFLLSIVLWGCNYDGWCSDEEYHWHDCPNPKTNPKSEYGVHIWDDGVIATSATYESTGIKTCTCSTCGKIKSFVIPKLDKDDLTEEVASYFSSVKNYFYEMITFEQIRETQDDDLFYMWYSALTQENKDVFLTNWYRQKVDNSFLYELIKRGGRIIYANSDLPQINFDRADLGKFEGEKIPLKNLDKIKKIFWDMYGHYCRILQAELDYLHIWGLYLRHILF